MTERAPAARSAPPAPGVLIIVQNLPVPFDRRVWLECEALVGAGYRVSVVCPRGPGDPATQVLEGVTLYKYRLPPTGTGKGSYAREYLYSFLATAWLTLRAWHTEPFAVLQACNPPDIFWPLALLLRTRGVSFVFDHHDLCPELYEAKFGSRRSLLNRLLRRLERCTFRAADHVISTNESYRSVAIERGGKLPDEVTVVRSGPHPERMRRRDPCPELRRGRRYLVVYLGVMGPQDGVDLAMLAADHIVHRVGRSDISFTFIGSGESYPELVDLRDRLGLGGDVELPGRLPDDDVGRLLSTADAGLCPDPKNPLNDLCTMNKTMEYMAYGLPVVAFDLHETRVSADGAALYAEPNEVVDFAEQLLALLEDDQKRRAMGSLGRRRVVDTLSWSRQQEHYVQVFDQLTSKDDRTEVPLPLTVAAAS